MNGFLAQAKVFMLIKIMSNLNLNQSVNLWIMCALWAFTLIKSLSTATILYEIAGSLCHWYFDNQCCLLGITVHAGAYLKPLSLPLQRISTKNLYALPQPSLPLDGNVMLYSACEIKITKLKWYFKRYAFIFIIIYVAIISMYSIYYILLFLLA